MTTSIREQIQVAAAALVGGEWGVPAPQDEQDLPFTSLDDGTDTVIESDYETTRLEMSVVVARAALATSNNRAAMHAQSNELYAQLVKELTGPDVDETLDGLADGIDFLGGGTLEEVGKFVFAIVNFKIRYHHITGDPYTIEEE
jgi:hypothetical protein